MKPKKKSRSAQQKYTLKRPKPGLLIFFLVLIVLFVLFIYIGIRAGEYAELLKQDAAASRLYHITEVQL